METQIDHEVDLRVRRLQAAKDGGLPVPYLNWQNGDLYESDFGMREGPAPVPVGIDQAASRNDSSLPSGNGTPAGEVRQKEDEGGLASEIEASPQPGPSLTPDSGRSSSNAQDQTRISRDSPASEIQSQAQSSDHGVDSNSPAVPVPVGGPESHAASVPESVQPSPPTLSHEISQRLASSPRIAPPPGVDTAVGIPGGSKGMGGGTQSLAPPTAWRGLKRKSADQQREFFLISAATPVIRIDVCYA